MTWRMGRDGRRNDAVATNVKEFHSESGKTYDELPMNTKLSSPTSILIVSRSFLYNACALDGILPILRSVRKIAKSDY
jgi:hypothetical protein